MKLKRWIGFVSIRWFGAAKENGGSASSLLAGAGIAVGVAALVVVLGVMNGFQLGYINSILDVSSFHVRVDDQRVFSGTASSGPDEALISHIAAEPGVKSVLPFVETRCLISARDGRSFPLVVRAMPEDAPKRDPDMMKAFGIEGSTPPDAWPGRGGLFLGTEIARYLDLKPGSNVDLLVVSGGNDGIEAKTITLRIDGLFRSGYYDFDFGMAIMPFSAASAIFPKEVPAQFVYGIKLHDRNSDAFFCERLMSDFGLGSDRAESWRDYNRAFFGALRIEKTVMMLLVGLIFLVVGVNIFHSMRRAVAVRSEDIAVLKAMGASPGDIGRVFIIDGLVIGTGGAIVGLCIGLLIAVNVNEVFSIVEAVVNGFSMLASRIAGSLGGGGFRVFSPQYFYLMEVPVRVLFPETFFVTAAAIAAAAAASSAAARSVSKLPPAEVLRYE